MSLVKLLAAGKSVVGLRNEISPYRLTDQRLLPKFGPDKGPVWLPKAGPCSTVKGPGGGRSPKCEMQGPKCVEAVDGSGAGSGLKGLPTASVGAPSRRGHPARVLGWLRRSPTAAVAAPPPGGPRLARAGRWLTSRFNGLFGRSGLKPERQPSPRLDLSAVQGELRLERIKVVRNDFSESDLELVELRPRAAATKPQEVGLGKRVSSRLAGVRSLLGLFGANRT
jgi:hypothetical protein